MTEQNDPGEEKLDLKIRLPGGKEEGKRFRNAAALVVGAMAFEGILTDHEQNKDDWVQKQEGGVKMWVNRKTGDVRTEPPWIRPEPQVLVRPPMSTLTKVISRRPSTFLKKSMSSMKSPKSNNNSRNSSPKIQRTRSKSLDFDAGMTPSMLGEGTGSLIYDHEPMDELFQLLDQYSNNNKKTSKKNGPADRGLMNENSSQSPNLSPVRGHNNNGGGGGSNRRGSVSPLKSIREEDRQRKRNDSI